MSTVTRPADGGFRHQAFFYAGADEFLAGTSAFIRDAVVADEPVLVVVGDAKIEQLRAQLGSVETRVWFADMGEVGRNPARIIPAWAEFLEQHGGWERPVRGIGEPIWAGRTAAELVEWQHHESLLNMAFADAPAFTLLCPYDTRSLGAEVIGEARRSHPFLVYGPAQRTSHDYRGLDAVAPFDGALPEPPAGTEELVFEAGPLDGVRRVVAAAVAGAGVDPGRAADFVIAVNEVATNSLCHGGGGGALRVWHEGDAVVCEVRDRGQIRQPLVGRRQPSRHAEGGRGLWLANQLCDLVQVRSSPAGTTVRLHVWRADAMSATG
jgi:anti-sigma regulatory factor (Ser/Thr protein kinase)